MHYCVHFIVCNLLPLTINRSFAITGNILDCVSATHEESILAANSNGRKFLYNSKGLDAGSLLVK